MLGFRDKILLKAIRRDFLWYLFRLKFSSYLILVINNLFYNQISSKIVQLFLREKVTNIYPSIDTFSQTFIIVIGQ